MRTLLLLAGLTGLFLGWNVPNHYPPWPTFHGELAAALGMSVVFLGLLWPQPSALTAPARTPLPMPMAARALALVGLVPVLQYLAGGLIYRGDALIGLLYSLGAALGVYAGALWAAQEGSARVLKLVFGCIALSGIAAAGIALTQWLGLGTLGWWSMELIESRPYGNLAQTNHFGLLMVLSVIAATALFETHELSHRASYYLALALFGSMLMVCQSRAALIAMAAVTLLWGVTRRRMSTRLRVSEVLALAGIGLLLYFFGLGAIERALYLAAPATRDLLAVGPRAPIWQLFWAAVELHPWLGYGFGQGVLALTEVAAQGQPAFNSIYAHNFVLDLMVWFGIPLAIVMTAALAWWLFGWFRQLGEPVQLAQRHWALAVWLAFAIQSLLEYPFAHTYFLLPAALLAGAVSGAPTAAGSATLPRTRASGWAIALAVVATGLLLALARDYIWLEGDFRANRFERANFTNRPDHESLGQPLVLDQLAAVTASAHLEIRAGMPAEEIEHLRTLTRRFHFLPLRLDYARALALNGRLAEAEHEIRILHGLYQPYRFQLIEQQWRNWLRENRLPDRAPD
jgi:O-antigen ligase